MQNTQQTTNIVIAALGGEGGGTLVSWIEDIAYNAGWFAQATSIAGVAQRTGATIYYIELFPDRLGSAKPPVMSMFPAAGDIDLAICSEIAEAGRLIQRGFCTRDRTTLIASSHHVYGITEKVMLGDGSIDSREIVEVAAQQCKQLISFDMQELAVRHGTVISASLLGALAGSKALPFSKSEYLQVIGQGNKLIENNLAAFQASYNKALAPKLAVEPGSPKPIAFAKDVQAFTLPQPTTENGARLLNRIEQTFPSSCHEFLTLGVEKLLDYQDHDYAWQYLDQMNTVLPLDSSANSELTRETARHLALWMGFEDTARVAQIKTRSTRSDHLRNEVKAQQNQILHVTEFFAPRLEELVQPLPSGLARAILKSPLCNRLAKPFTKGRRLRTDTILSFVLLRIMAFSRNWRRKTYHFALEHKLIDDWLHQIKRYAKNDLNAAINIAKCARIVKGYGKTRERGSEQIEVILKELNSSSLSAANITDLQNAALSDDSNTAFSDTLARLHSATI